MLHALAQVGFQQSYTYFTWRNTKAELEEFFSGLAHETDAFLRPNLFVNTPDILTEYLQFGGTPAFRIRAALAATASPSWGCTRVSSCLNTSPGPAARRTSTTRSMS